MLLDYRLYRYTITFFHSRDVEEIFTLGRHRHLNLSLSTYVRPTARHMLSYSLALVLTLAECGLETLHTRY